MRCFFQWLILYFVFKKRNFGKRFCTYKGKSHATKAKIIQGYVSFEKRIIHTKAKKEKINEFIAIRTHIRLY